MHRPDPFDAPLVAIAGASICARWMGAFSNGSWSAVVQEPVERTEFIPAQLPAELYPGAPVVSWWVRTPPFCAM